MLGGKSINVGTMANLNQQRIDSFGFIGRMGQERAKSIL
jgi:hypothetical protein